MSRRSSRIMPPTDPGAPVTGDVQRAFATLCTEAIADGSVDRELHVEDAARWLAGLVLAHRAVRAAHPEAAGESDLAVLRASSSRAGCTLPVHADRRRRSGS